jgi:GNAT superfamily N-acetyltransferase
MGHFRLSPLRGDRILQAYPLVCAAAGELSVEAWRAYVKDMLGARARATKCCDIVGLCSPNGYLRGLFTYQVTADLHHGRTLDVEYFALESVYSPRDIIAALMAGAEDEALEHGCSAIHATTPSGKTKTPSGQNLMSEMLEARAYIDNSRIWCKRAD